MIDVIGIALGEASFWRGLAMVLASLGVVVDPEDINTYMAIGMGVSGVIGMFTKRKGK